MDVSWSQELIFEIRRRWRGFCEEIWILCAKTEAFVTVMSKGATKLGFADEGNARIRVPAGNYFNNQRMTVLSVVPSLQGND